MTIPNDVIGESVVSVNMGENEWLGTLLNISPSSGYWLKVYGDDVLQTQGLPSGSVSYSLNEGNNYHLTHMQ